MPKRATRLSDANTRLHKNHSYELQVATWLMQGGWQVFTPLLDAAHAVDLIASDGPHSYRLQIKSIESQDEHHQVTNAWKGKHIDFVIYFAQRSNWGYVCPAFDTNLKRLDDSANKRFAQNAKSFLAAFHTCERHLDNKSLPTGGARAK
jgi:Holliday junction resolvase-like predicted endonuclease